VSPVDTILPLVARRLEYRVGGEQLLGPIDFEINGRGRTVVLGPNGAGKSLLLRLAHGLLQPSSGSLEWRTQDGAELRRRQAMVFDRAVLLRRSARANVEYALGLHGVRGAERQARAAQALERTGLTAIAERAARALSAGEQQRLALARAWALRPEVLFLDEPTASLDPAAARRVEELILEIGAAGTAIVMTTHDLALARRIGDDVLFLHLGLLNERAPAAEFFAAPRTAEARAFQRGELTW
jgi:tungstate transport system ATP-binding protein